MAVERDDATALLSAQLHDHLPDESAFKKRGQRLDPEHAGSRGRRSSRAHVDLDLPPDVVFEVTITLLRLSLAASRSMTSTVKGASKATPATALGRLHRGRAGR